MNDKLQKLKEKHELEEYQVQVDSFNESQKEESLIFLGQIRAVGALARGFSSQEIRALELFQQENRYRHLGFSTFVEFLNSDYCPKITKAQFYERLALLNAEGNQVFDLLNEIGVAASTRKLLAAGEYDAIIFDGDKVRIGESEAALSDVRAVRALIESYADDCKRLKDENKKQTEKIEKGKKDYDRLKERLVEAEESTVRTDYTKNPLEKQNSIALGGLAGLADELSRATLVDCNRFVDGNLKLLATQYNRVQQILCEKLSVESADELLLNDSDEDRLTSLLEDED